MRTLLLDLTIVDREAIWDLTLDSAGNIAVADEPYAEAQDVASAIRTWRGELWYDTDRGVPYLGTFFGGLAPPVQFMKAMFVAQALSVPAVTSARCFLDLDRNTRELTGQVQITTFLGTVVVGFNPSSDLPWYVQAVDPRFPPS